ncbi:MAG: hypothetical protein K9N09_04435 [Candidatus Cloacimonetes bacterium]|nr:hypothetical protein [Candidatus Cloacimonadota bacterium]MCF7813612.1 hypothetical protein [Candidatus Cloacimonadota bacterium]MCF7867928.1 hypothetical protein [Candidatus Cloacimonadota bacterium]MCF7882879.1 hypothetical protein [Candidatus Cloacimonadota bacterium]
MKDLEIKLENMSVPQIEDEQFEYKLRRDLLDRYHQKTNNYRFRFRAAMAFCCLLLVFGCATILNPDVAVKINNMAFKKDIKIVPADQDCFSLENLAYTSIYNPNLTSKLDPDKFQEDKTYLVRKYVSSEEGGVMIVSEFDQKQNKKQSAKRISY